VDGVGFNSNEYGVASMLCCRVGASNTDGSDDAMDAAAQWIEEARAELGFDVCASSRGVDASDGPCMTECGGALYDQGWGQRQA
jgi:hypothetical protein